MEQQQDSAAAMLFLLLLLLLLVGLTAALALCLLHAVACGCAGLGQVSCLLLCLIVHEQGMYAIYMASPCMVADPAVVAGLKGSSSLLAGLKGFVPHWQHCPAFARLRRLPVDNFVPRVPCRARSAAPRVW
jgi:hypothetical protein